MLDCGVKIEARYKMLSFDVVACAEKKFYSAYYNSPKYLEQVLRTFPVAVKKPWLVIDSCPLKVK